MSTRQAIFISAVSKELKGARQLVANTLQFLGYEPVWQDIFGAQEGDLRAVLRRQIDACKGVVQLVGRRYGAEPPTPDEAFGRVSYTQYEALYARQRGKKVWYLLLDETFPVENQEPEPAELRALQDAYRRRLQSDTHLYHPLNSLEGLEADVLKLRDDLSRLRRGARRWSVGVGVLLVVIAALCTYLVWAQQRAPKAIDEAVSKRLTQDRAQIVEQAVAEYRKQEQQGKKGDVAERDAVTVLAKKYGLDEKTMAEKLRAFAGQTQDSPEATTWAKANAACLKQNYPEAERLCLKAVHEAKLAKPPQTANAIAAYTLASWAATKRFEYAEALEYLREAEKLTNRQAGPLEWAEVQRGIGHVLYLQGNFRAAAAVAREDVAERLKWSGSDNLDSLFSRNNLAAALFGLGQYAEAEKEHRGILAVRERLLGKDHPETLLTRLNLVTVLRESGQLDEALKENQLVLAACQRVLGPEDPLTLAARHCAGTVLEQQEKFPEAEKELRAVLALYQRVVGPEHPDTLGTQFDLALVLYDLDQPAAAEELHRAVLAIQPRVLGPEHPATLKSRYCLAITLEAQHKYHEAEEELRRVLAIRTRVLGADHPITFETWHRITLELFFQEKFPELAEELTSLIAAEERVYGADTPREFSPRQRLAFAFFRVGKYKEAVACQEKVLAIAQKGTDADAKAKQVTAYIGLARYRLLARDFAGALASAEAGVALDGGELLLQVRKADALLLLGKAPDAEAIYQGHRGKVLPGPAKRSWEQTILQDFDDLEKAGIASPEFARIRGLLKPN